MTGDEVPIPLRRSDDERFASNMRRLREHLGLSQGELARRITDAGLDGFHQTTVSRIEKGERPVRLSEAKAIATALGALVSTMVAETDEAKALADMDEAISRMRHARRDLTAAAYEYVEAQRWLAVQRDLTLEVARRINWSDDQLRQTLERIAFRASVEMQQQTALDIVREAVDH